ncbi:MAG: phosphoribosylformylglycinamidine synthase subunit PurL, partial [Halanaerobiales bacterium]
MSKIDKELKSKLEFHGMTESEYEIVVDLMGRKPNDLELGLFGVMWSEHCGYKHSRAMLRKFPTEGEQVLQGPGENAGIVDIGDGQALAFKMESHNHPSAIEPYEGAATGIGGIVRDVFTMGARPIALFDPLRFGDLDDDYMKYIFNGVISGISDYGNSIGVPTVGGEAFFNSCYQGNPLVNVMCVGFINHEDIITAEAKGVGNPVMVVGTATGRDGIQGASFASAELHDDSEEDRPSVQVGDPFMEKLLLEACLELYDTGAVVGIQDMGAAGLISSSCEMASRSGQGMEIDVDLVPKREPDMTPYEIMLSESQERMLVVPEKGREKEVEEIFNKWGLHAEVVGKVTNDGLLTIKEAGKTRAEIPPEYLTDEVPEYVKEGKKPDYQNEVNQLNLDKIQEPEDYNEVLEKLMGSLNLCSKEWIYEQYDHMVRNNTVILPGSDAAVLRIKDTDKAVAITADGNGRYIYLDPETGGKLSLAEAARNIVCSGARPLAITDCLNFGNPEKEEIYWQFRKAIKGISEACLTLNTPVVSGNVSFYNETKGEAIYPTPVLGMVGVMDNVKNATSSACKEKGDVIYLLGKTEEEIGGSEYLSQIHELEKGLPPVIDLDFEKKLQDSVLELIQSGKIKSAHDVADGGLAVALAESCIQGEIGARIDVDNPGNIRTDALLFGESVSRIIISVSAGDSKYIEKELEKSELPYQKLGE